MEQQDRLDRAARMLVDCFRTGGKLLLCGNGGSAADCAHIAGELIKGFLLRRRLPDALQARFTVPGAESLQLGLPVIDMTANAAAMTAIINDLGGDCVFAQQVLAYGKKGDVLLGISTSGNARNVRMAMEAARALNMATIGMTGEGGGAMAPLCDLLLAVPDSETYRVQEQQQTMYHILCARVEAEMFG